jgi:hypothetical protein
VRTKDFYRTIAPFTFASVVALGVSIAVRSFAGIHNPIVGLIALFITTGLVTLLALGALPAGRLALLDIKKTIALILKRRQEVVLVP